MSKEPIRVLITGAAGQIGYPLTFAIASGAAFGPDQPLILHLLDIEPMMVSLSGTVMELEDCAFPLLRSVVATADLQTAFDQIDYCLMVGSMPRREGMERKDLLKANCGIFKTQGEALDKYAKKTVKVLVVGNPANTNALVCMETAKSIPHHNFTALTRLDHNRAIGQIAKRAKVSPQEVHNVIIWGNHSSTQYPDVNHATIGGAGGKAARSVLNDDTWLQGEFITLIQKRGATVIEKRKASSAGSAAKAIVDHVRDWVHGTREGEWVSMAVPSDGSYGIKEGVIFSYPVSIKNGEWKIVPGLEIDEFSKSKLTETEKELREEREEALSFLK